MRNYDKGNISGGDIASDSNEPTQSAFQEATKETLYARGQEVRIS